MSPPALSTSNVASFFSILDTLFPSLTFARAEASFLLKSSVADISVFRDDSTFPISPLYSLTFFPTSFDVSELTLSAIFLPVEKAWFKNPIPD